MCVQPSLPAQKLSCTRKEYRDDAAIAQSDVKLAHESPLLYEAIRVRRAIPDPEPTSSQAWGTECEEALQAKGMPPRYALIPPEVLNDQGHRRGKPWKEFQQSIEPWTVAVTHREINEKFGPMGCYTQVLRNVRRHKMAQALLYSRRKRDWHVRLKWACPRTGVVRKGELDVVNWGPRIVVDIKSAADPTPRGFSIAMRKFFYDVQAVTYLEGVKQFTQNDDWRFSWVVVRNSAPYDVWVYEDEPSFLEAAQMRADHLLDELIERYNANNWLPLGWGSSIPISYHKDPFHE